MWNTERVWFQPGTTNWSDSESGKTPLLWTIVLQGSMFHWITNRGWVRWKTHAAPSLPPPPGTWCCPPVLASYCPSQDHHSLGYGYNWGDLIIQYISQLTEPFTYKVLFVFESHTAQYQYESVGVTVWLQQILCFTNDTSGRLKNGLNLVAYCLSWQPRNYTTIRESSIIPPPNIKLYTIHPLKRLCEFTEAPWRWLLLGPLHALLSLGTARSRATHLHHIRPDGRSKKTWIS